jgi:hypothetical protein
MNVTGNTRVLVLVLASALCPGFLLARAATPSEANTNPKVQPGKVNWHPSFASARQAAEKSGKPVLLFQMMGKLDDQFC